MSLLKALLLVGAVSFAALVHADDGNGDLTRIARQAAGQELAVTGHRNNVDSEHHSMHEMMSRMSAEDKRRMMKQCMSMMGGHKSSDS